MPAKQLPNAKERRFRLLFSEHPQPMWILDPESRAILAGNTACTALYGYSIEEFRGMPLARILGEEQARTLSFHPGDPAQPPSIAGAHTTKDRRIVQVEMDVHPIEYGGRPAALAVLMDRTGGKQIEDQLRQARKMEAVGMLAGGVAHDFNNLLTIITGYGQLVLNNLGPTDPNRDSVEQIVRAGERAGALTGQLLSFSRRQALQPKVLDLNELVTGLGAMLRRLIGEDIDLRLALSAGLGRVSADPGQIEQVLMNLVVNARDAMPDGGAVTIETANAEADEGASGRPGPRILLAVSDTGAGMDERTKERLFEPFFTTKGAGKGTGLGLSTVLAIVKQSGGGVQVQSEPGRGTSVKVYLPRVDQPVPVESALPLARTRRGGETILLVEDDEMVRTLVRETLRREGYVVLDAAGPLEANRISDGRQARIELLISDLVMPQAGGRDLARQLLKARPEMKVLFMSGYADGATAGGGDPWPEAAFIQKPFTPAALAGKVREVLAGGHGRKKRAGE
jgi:PAS domain S-box-containing protein